MFQMLIISVGIQERQLVLLASLLALTLSPRSIEQQNDKQKKNFN